MRPLAEREAVPVVDEDLLANVFASDNDGEDGAEEEEGEKQEQAQAQEEKETRTHN